MQFPSLSPFPPFPTPKGPQATFLTGLLFGLICGAGVSLVTILYIFLVWHGALPWLYNMEILRLPDILDPFYTGLVITPLCLDLLLFILCLVAGLLAARRTQRALSGTWAGLSGGVVFVLVRVMIFLLNFDVFRLEDDSLSFFILTLLLGLIVGTYLGFLGGLLGRKRVSVKKSIGIFYSISMVLFGMSLLAGVYTFVEYFEAPFPRIDMIIFWVTVLLQTLAGVSGLVATILTLIEFYRARAWTQFILTFFFGGILTLIYLITGAQPAPVPQNSPLVAASLPPSSLPVALAITPAQPSALDILQQRLAKGEIDEATYHQLAAVLEKQR